MDRFRIRSGFETIQMLFHSGVVNAQEFVGGGHHVNTIGLSLSTFLIHKLVHRLMAEERWKITLITRNNVLRRAEEPRLEMLRLRTSIWPDWYGGASMPAKATNAFWEWKRRTAPISAISWGREPDHNTEHPHHNGVLRQRCRQRLHF